MTDQRRIVAPADAAPWRRKLERVLMDAGFDGAKARQLDEHTRRYVEEALGVLVRLLRQGAEDRPVQAAAQHIVDVVEGRVKIGIEDDFTWLEPFRPKVLPQYWVMLKEYENGALYTNDYDGRRVILTGAIEQDGRRWIHLSVSCKGRLPSWEELIDTKNLFFGEERYAYQVLPPKSKHVNVHDYVLHLWHCVDGDPIPDFTRGGSAI